MAEAQDDRERPTLVLLPAMLCNDELYRPRPQIERLRDLVEPMTLKVAEATMAEAAAEVLRRARHHVFCSRELRIEEVLPWKSSPSRPPACSGCGSWDAILGRIGISRSRTGATSGCKVGSSNASSRSWRARSHASRVPTPSAQRTVSVAWRGRRVRTCSCVRTPRCSVGLIDAPTWAGSPVGRWWCGAGMVWSALRETALR